MIRRGRPGDLPAVRRLQALLPDPTPELLAATRPAALYVAVERDPTGRGRDATGRERVVGYLLPVDGADRHVAEAVVAPAFRRRGHGRALFEAAIADVAPGTRVTLLVAAGNDAARSLYGDLGFEAVERRPDAYEGDERMGVFMALETGDGS